MENNSNVILWYANNANNDKYVTCISAMMEQMRAQGESVACKRLEIIANLDFKQRWTKRRHYWLLSVRLHYAEYVKCEVYVNEVLDVAVRLKNTTDDDYTRKMFEVLEAACYVSLYRISKGRILPLFKQYHYRLLSIVDDLIELQQESASTVSRKSFLEDCNRVFDIVADIEKICGSRLYQSNIKTAQNNSADQAKSKPTKSTIIVKQKAKLLPFRNKQDDKIDNIFTYLTQWLGYKNIDKNNPQMRRFLGCVERAKIEVDHHIGISSDILFSWSGMDNKSSRINVKHARRYMQQALDNKGITSDKHSFWKLYIDLIIQKAIKAMGKNNFNLLNNDNALRQAARWPLHEKMHGIITMLARDPQYLEHLLDKEIIHSESLLFGVFSTLAMRNVSVVYCGYNIIRHDPENPKFKLNCYNGRGLERIYKELVELVYKISYYWKKTAFCVHLCPETGFNLSLEIACVYTGEQVVMVGIPKDFRLDQYHYHSSAGILGDLFTLVGFEFSQRQVMAIHGPITAETSALKLKSVELEPTQIKLGTGFIPNFIAQQSPPLKIIAPKYKLQSSNMQGNYFDEIIAVVREA